MAGEKINFRESLILVTGAAGFIGRHLVRRFVERHARVVGLALPGEDVSCLDGLGVEIVRGDILDKSSLHPAVAGVDIVCHLAGIMTSDDPERFLIVNFEGTRNLVQACRESGTDLKRFLFVSSISAAGPTGGILANEDSPSNPGNEYGRSKLLAESFLKSPENPFPYTIIRPVEIYGPGRFDSFYQICRAAKNGFEVHIGEGEVTLGFVGDVAEGMVLACENPSASGRTYYLGENTVHSLSEVTACFARAVRPKPIRIRIPYPLLYSTAFFLEGFAKVFRTKPAMTRWQLESYVRRCSWKFDITRAEKELGFRAGTALAEGAKITVEWYRENGYL